MIDIGHFYQKIANFAFPNHSKHFTDASQIHHERRKALRKG